MKLTAILLMLICIVPITLAIEFDEDVSDEDKATFDQILEPLSKII